VGAVSAVTEFSPALTWARGADKLAFTYFDNGDYTVWSTDNPRNLKGAAFREENNRRIVASARPIKSDSAVSAPALATSATDSMTMSFYRGQFVRNSGDLAEPVRERSTISIAALRDSAEFMLPDTTRFVSKTYKGILEAEILSRPSIGYSPDNFGQGVYGQSVLILSDLIGNQQMALAGGLNGRLSEAQFFGAYTNLSRRFQYMAGVSQEPYFYSAGGGLFDLGGGLARQEEHLNRYIFRSAFSVAQYPFTRFKRLELGLSYNHVDRATMIIARDVLLTSGLVGQWFVDDVISQPGVSFLQPMVAYVHDNTLFGYTGPIMGTRMRLQMEPAIGGLRWMTYLADVRRYEPVVFNFITVALRGYARVAVGRDEEAIPAYIGNPLMLRGYNRQVNSQTCRFTDIRDPQCPASRLVGSRVGVVSGELRFPLVRAFHLGLLPIALPPIDGVAFYDAGMAWSTGDKTEFFSTVPMEEQASTRFPLRSYGYGVRLNLYNLALLRWDYSIPLDLDSRKGFWTFSIGPSF
jgi:hypothetical protein